MKKRILVTRSSMPPMEEYIDEIKELWESHWLTNMGAKHQELQRKLIEYLGVEQIDLFTNGHMAAYSARTAHPFQRNGAPFRFKLSKARQVD